MRVKFKENDGKYRILANLHSATYLPASGMIYVEGMKHSRGFEVSNQKIANQIIDDLYEIGVYDFSDYKVVR